MRSVTNLLKFVVLILLISFSCFARSDEPQTQDAAMFESIRVMPANQEGLVSNFEMHPESDEIGTEQPPTISYFKKDSKDYATVMAVTDLSLCKRPDQKMTCQSFVKAISDPAPAIGFDLTETRIEGSDYTTVFLARVDSVQFDGVDSAIAFIGGDSQDPPMSEITLYIYAKKGTNLIQLSIPVEKCTHPLEPGQSEVAYYQRYCVTKPIIEKAKLKSKVLTELFRLKR